MGDSVFFVISRASMTDVLSSHLFFEDSLNSLREKEMVADFHNNNLFAFEDIKTAVTKIY